MPFTVMTSGWLPFGIPEETINALPQIPFTTDAWRFHAVAFEMTGPIADLDAFR